MLQNITKHIPLTTIIVSYFFICGGLYLIGFWGTFNIDISNLVSLADIPKSFILPFAITQGFYFMYMLLSAFTTRFLDDLDDPEPKAKRTHKSKWKRLFYHFATLNTVFVIALFIILLNFGKYRTNTEYWIILTTVIALFMMYKVVTSPFVKEKIPFYNIRIYTAHILCFLPITCFGLGKVASINIYNNHNIKIIQTIKTETPIIKSDTISLKLLGFIGDKLIISSFDNKKIIFINQSSYDKVEFTDPK